MKTRYYVCGLGYDVNGNITDYEKDYGNFDTYEQAYARFVTIQCMSGDVLFANARGVNQILLQLEECEETEEEINCIDVKNEWWIVNPNFTFTAYTRSQYNGIYFIDDKTTFDSKEEAIAFAKVHNWDGVMDNGTGEIVWENKEDVK